MAERQMPTTNRASRILVCRTSRRDMDSQANIKVGHTSNKVDINSNLTNSPKANINNNLTSSNSKGLLLHSNTPNSLRIMETTCRRMRPMRRMGSSQVLSRLSSSTSRSTTIFGPHSSSWQRSSDSALCRGLQSMDMLLGEVVAFMVEPRRFP